MSFFKRSGSYNLYSFGRVGYKNDVNRKNIWEHMFFFFFFLFVFFFFFMQASDCVIIYLNKNNFCVALSTICDTFLYINTQKCYFHLFGRNKFFRL